MVFLQFLPSLASVDCVKTVLLRWAQFFSIEFLLFASLHVIYHLKMQIKRRVQIVSSNIRCSLTRIRSKLTILNFKTRESWERIIVGSLVLRVKPSDYSNKVDW